MTIRVELNPEVEAWLVAQARAIGLSVEKFAEGLLRSHQFNVSILAFGRSAPTGLSSFTPARRPDIPPIVSRKFLFLPRRQEPERECPPRCVYTRSPVWHVSPSATISPTRRGSALAGLKAGLCNLLLTISNSWIGRWLVTPSTAEACKFRM